MARRGTKRSRRLEGVIILSLGLLLVITLSSWIWIQQLLKQTGAEDNTNLQLTETSLRQANIALEQQLPLMTGLDGVYAQSLNLQNEFELLILDPTRADDQLHTLLQALYRHQHQLAPAIDGLPGDLAHELRENLGVLIDLTEELLNTPSNNRRQQLYRDSLYPLQQVQHSLQGLNQLLEEQNLRLRAELLKINHQSQQALNRHEETTWAIVWVLAGTLGTILLLTLLAELGFFSLLYRRIALLERFADRISHGRFQRAPFSSRDHTGILAIRLAQTGRRIKHLLAGIRRETEKTESARREAERLAFYDPLTGLENRRLFLERLENDLQIHARHLDDHLALIYLDLDDFKQINDSLGHDAGDQLLKTVSRRLRLTLREEDCLARLGGDEFAMLVHCDEDECAALAQRILTLLQRPIDLGDRELQVSTSIGIALAERQSSASQPLLKHADLALYRAKALGRNNYQFFSEALNRQAHERMELLAALRQANPHRDFQLYYQPKYCLKDRKLIGLEALIRWNHPTQGFIPPDRFIPIAEESGLIVPIGEWILRTACQQAKHLEELGTPLSIAINISARQFHDHHLINQVRQALYQTGLSPQLLELEITETMLIQDIEQSIRMLETLKREGIRVAIDDFGTGYSSLSYLKRLPLDTLKIDRSFLGSVTQNRHDAAIVETLIELGQRMRVTVVAEGVETEAQERFLQARGCDIGQGLRYSLPRPIEELGIHPSLTAHSATPL